MKVNIHDVAKKAGLSIVTVSRVLNNVETVREKNRIKVLQAIEELNYHPNAAARSLSKGSTGVIGIIAPTAYDYYHSKIIQSIDEYMEQKSYYLAISFTDMDHLSNQRSSYLFQEDRVDGIILLSPFIDEPYILDLKRKNIPFVLIDNQHPKSSITSVLVDNYYGGYLAAKHLIELGHKKIAHIKGPSVYLSSIEREKGFYQALSDNGLSPYWVEEGDFTITTAYKITKNKITPNDYPTAIFAADDSTGLGIIDALKESALKVPEDISIIGYDDHILCSSLHPHLTTIRQPAWELGQKGAELLFKMLREKNYRNQTIRLKPELVIRDSTIRRR